MYMQVLEAQIYNGFIPSPLFAGVRWTVSSLPSLPYSVWETMGLLPVPQGVQWAGSASAVKPSEVCRGGQSAWYDQRAPPPQQQQYQPQQHYSHPHQYHQPQQHHQNQQQQHQQQHQHQHQQMMMSMPPRGGGGGGGGPNLEVPLD